MPAPDIFNIGVSGLIGSQLGLSTTSHNIANANTEGYSRQIVQFETRLPSNIGGRFFGTGIDVGDVSRIYNQTIIYELRSNQSTFSAADNYLQQAQQLDNVVANASTGLDSSIQSFFNAMHGVSESPSSIPARQVLLSQVQLIANRFNSLNDTFQQQSDSLSGELTVAADQITKIASTIAELNNQIKTAQSDPSAGKPNDLLDSRDKLLNDLSKLITIGTLAHSDGTIDVNIGSGQSLVSGTFANILTAAPSPSDPSQLVILIGPQGSANPTDVTAQMSGGLVGGLLQFRDELLQPALNTLGRVAITLAQTVNAQHALGMDLNNNLGGLVFTDFNTANLAVQRANADSNNTGGASVNITIDNANQLTDSNYSLSLQAGTWSVTRLSDNTIVQSFADPGGPASVQIGSEGFTVNFTGAAAANGDSFQIYPTRGMAGKIAREIDDVRELAAASPVVMTNPSTNTGSGIIKPLVVSDTSTAAFQTTAQTLTPPLHIVFTSATTYDVQDAGTNAVLASGVFVPNQDNKLLAQAVPPLDATMGYEVTLSGVPATGDQFDVKYNSGGAGDNRNMQALVALQSAGTMDNGLSTYTQGYGRLISNVGTRTNEADVTQQSSQTLLRQTEARQESFAGVNLDEEAANLLRFQQAYEASAQVITVARSLFDTLFQAIQ